MTNVSMESHIKVSYRHSAKEEISKLLRGNLWAEGKIRYLNIWTERESCR